MDNRRMMGLDSPADQKIPVSVRDWQAMKLAIWRSKAGWDIIARTALDVIARCKHVQHCPGLNDEKEPCYANCQDREMRMSALVTLNVTRQFAAIDARKPSADPYFAPSRELYSEVIAELGRLQIENDALREALKTAGVEAPAPPPNEVQELRLPKQEPFKLEDQDDEDEPEYEEDETEEHP